MSAPIGPEDDNAVWQRPDGSAGAPGNAAPTGAGQPYQGPPRAAPPPPDWRPPVVRQPAAPRSLPPQDETALDEAERSARTVTYGVGMVAGAVLLVVMFLLCARVLF